MSRLLRIPASSSRARSAVAPELVVWGAWRGCRPTNHESLVMVELKFRVVPGVTSVDGTTVIVAGKSQPPESLPTRAR